MFITLNLTIDPKTGKPAVWSNDNGELRPFVLDEIMVPLEYRKWLTQRGDHLKSYIGNDFEMCNAADAETFYENLPDREIDECTEEELEFMEALAWFASKKVFTLSWSY